MIELSKAKKMLEVPLIHIFKRYSLVMYFFLDPSYKANGKELEMKLKYLMSVLFLNGEIEIKSIIAVFIPEHKQMFTRKRNMLIRAVVEKKPLIKGFGFVGTNKSITKSTKNELKSRNYSNM